MDTKEITREAVRRKLFEKYIAPTDGRKKNLIGIEIEMPLYNKKREPVDFDIVHLVTAEFMDAFSFVVEKTDEEGQVISAVHEATGDILSYDCSYNNLELSMGAEKELFEIHDRFRTYYVWLQDAFSKYDHGITGMGVNPYRCINRQEPIHNGRYRMLFHHLKSFEYYRSMPKYFHEYPGYGLFSSASQVQLDVKRENLIQTIRVFSLLEPVKAVLFANSVMLDPEAKKPENNLQINRDMFWEASTHGINPHNIGMFDKLPETEEELLSYIELTSIYCVERGEKYINFTPIPLQEYFSKHVVEGEYFDGKEYQKIEIVPELSDIAYLRTFKFEDLTFRGTIEYRSCCCQPISDFMVIAAFHLGLSNRLDELDELLKNDNSIYHRGYTATELRKLFTRATLPDFVDADAFYGLVNDVLSLARDGLAERGLHEEVFLDPLFERARRRSNPAQDMLWDLAAGNPIEHYIEKYGKI